MLPEVRYHVVIMRQVTGARRELWIAREVSYTSSGTVSAQKRLSNQKGPDTELLMELASGSTGGRSPRHGAPHRHANYSGRAIAFRSLHSICGGPGGLCVKDDDLRAQWATLSPTHEARTDVAVLPEVRYHVTIMRQVTGTRRELWIAREVSCTSSGTVSAH